MKYIVTTVISGSDHQNLGLISSWVRFEHQVVTEEEFWGMLIQLKPAAAKTKKAITQVLLAKIVPHINAGTIQFSIEDES